MSHQLPHNFEWFNMEATARFQHEEQLAALYQHNYRLFWKLDEAEEDVDRIKRRIRRTTENLGQELCAAKTAVIRAHEQYNSSCEVLTYFLGKLPESERMGIRARCMARIPYKSGASRTSFAGTTVTTGIKTNDTTSRLLSLSVAMVRVGAMRQRIEIARQRVSMRHCWRPRALSSQSSRRCSRTPCANHGNSGSNSSYSTRHHYHHQRQQCVCMECGKFYRELRRPQGEWHQCWRCAAHRCDKCGHIVCGCLQDMDSPASP